MVDEQLGGGFVEIGGKSEKLKKDLAVAEGLVKSSLENAAKIASQFAGPAAKPFAAMLGTGAGVAAGVAAGAEAFDRFANLERTRVQLQTELARTGRVSMEDAEAFTKSLEAQGDALGLTTKRMYGLATAVARITTEGPGAIGEVLRLLSGAMQMHPERAPEDLTRLLTDALYKKSIPAIMGLEIPGVGAQALPREAIPRMKDVLEKRGELFAKQMAEDMQGKWDRTKAAIGDMYDGMIQNMGESVFGAMSEAAKRERFDLAQAGGVVESGVGPTARALGYHTQNMWAMPPDLWAINKTEIAQAATRKAGPPHRRAGPIAATPRPYTPNTQSMWDKGEGAPRVTGPGGVSLPYPDTGMAPAMPFFAPRAHAEDGAGRLGEAADKLEKAANKLNAAAEDSFAPRLR